MKQNGDLVSQALLDDKLRMEIDSEGLLMKIWFRKQADDEIQFHWHLPTVEEIETILRAVKKTHEKILNIEIQKIQDSKIAEHREGTWPF